MKSFTKKLSISILGLSSALIVNAETTGEWQESPKGFDYKSKVLSCTIGKKGDVRNLKTPKTVLLSKALIHAATSDAEAKKTDKKIDLRIFQNRKCDSIKVKKDGENKYSVALKGSLGNDKYKHLADYSETIILTPEKITFAYEVVSKEPLKMKYYQPFHTLQYAPCSSLKGLGYKSIDKKGKEKLCQFPSTYEKDNALRQYSLKSLRIVLPDGHAVLEAGENNTLSLSDARSWGSDNFRIDANPHYTSAPKPIDHPVGSKFEWSYSVSFEKK